ncbi:hypothetical protein [Arsenicicoccus dermatophilus]|uniref:hypothetical protein n=1 Tax=Arsenicicoccus dermatophilus TaxID=1076331 RepID=UPI001F4D2D4C|nr:hypothetical protein [Arsenicicoccus dermatophilus]MCH8612015.1 hypothetical protein [Arsenicicoccus dermatophilus]
MSDGPPSGAVRFGIKARFSGVCSLCGEPIEVGERIYRLPKKRAGAASGWVCVACRFPDPDRVVDLEFVIRKVEHRHVRGPCYTPRMAEVDVIVDAFDRAGLLTTDELVLGETFAQARISRQCPALGRAKMATLLAVLRRAGSKPEREAEWGLKADPWPRHGLCADWEPPL